MSKKTETSYLSPEDAARRQEEKDLIVQNFRLIYENAELIINTPEYFFCELETARLGLFYIGGGKLPLGVLLLLWKEGKFKDKCSVCGHDVYVCAASGSPLSGSFTWWGVCENCAQPIYFKRSGFRWTPVYEKMKEYKNEAIIEKGQEPIFSWSQGVVGEHTPDRIIKPKISGISLKDLIEILKSK